ncbi:MAG: methyl-accepting chemotaxis protein [Rhodoferax sp.]
MSFVNSIENQFQTHSRAAPDVTLSGAMGGADRVEVMAASERAAADDFGDSHLPPGEVDLPLSGADLLSVPLLGRRTPAQHLRILAILLGLALVALALATFFALNQANRVAQQVAATGQSLMQSQRLAKSAAQALLGSEPAFPELKDSTDVLTKSVRGLKAGDASLQLAPVNAADMAQVEKIAPVVERTSKNAQFILSQKSLLIAIGNALQTISHQSVDALNLAQNVETLELEQHARTLELSAASRLVMLSQRIGKSANEFLTSKGLNPDAVVQLGADLDAFRDTSKGLLDGSALLGLPGTNDPQTRAQISALIKVYGKIRAQADTILGSVRQLVTAREAQVSINSDSEPLRRELEALQSRLSSQSGLGLGAVAALILSALLALISAGGLAFVQLEDSRQRQGVADQQRMEAERQEQEAKRVNDANQAAILRLMNELQTVAEGDLTQEATVTEDITGAIADSVNYTVEELRLLVGNVQTTASRVAQTTAQVENTSAELLTTSGEQLREIREAGQSVLDMAGRINKVSSQAQESASVARQSLQAAESGLVAVQNAIGGMNSIRDQIQETSKRIKRLGESSQEIGEITELISDITEQTNVLALNAAIQAASAGDAGRGFSVVAEEVQRLAERSADATRQIAALVKAIQTDTQDAVAAMERSTHGVVEGAKLSDNAGTALSEIDRVSRRLAELIEQISHAALQEATSANVVAGNIQHIFVVTEQTGEGTRSTAQQVRELSRMAEELRQSVSRFKIA